MRAVHNPGKGWSRQELRGWLVIDRSSSSPGCKKGITILAGLNRRLSQDAQILPKPPNQGYPTPSSPEQENGDQIPCCSRETLLGQCPVLSGKQGAGLSSLRNVNQQGPHK